MRAIVGDPVAQARKGFAELLSIREKPSVNSTALLRPHKVSPRLAVPPHIPRPPYVDTGENPWFDDIQVHDAEGIQKMRAAGRLAADVLEHAGTLVKAGVTTDEIDKAVHKMIIENGAYPSPLTYGNFPKSVCTSVNECVCHGIPDARPLVEGDIINIDVTVYLNGHHGDTSRMFYVGKVSEKARKLCEVTQFAMESAIAECGPGVPIRNIGKVIHAIADKHKYGVVKEFVGHGVGRVFHSAPHVMHCRNIEPGVMQPGQTFTIEPMLTEGDTAWKMWKDQWTVVTKDGGWTAQFEHTILITPNGHEVLTTWPSKR
ncbi:Methionine aminopeptidase 1D, mitochondrial [Coccomyxa sp. Obi]|nr:Methionine aminopeptidase 1D, mitochondrial [Coccomyxa sp. Obi]